MKERINHPEHYNSGRYETIDIIDSAGHAEGFCLGNAFKYLMRARHKENYIEDLKKARWYLDYWIKALEKNETGEDKSNELI